MYLSLRNLTTHITILHNNQQVDKSTLAASKAVEDYVNSSMKSQLLTEDFSVEENEMDNDVPKSLNDEEDCIDSDSLNERWQKMFCT